MWIEIDVVVLSTVVLSGHSLRGLCGLKSVWALTAVRHLKSQPARAVWIEMMIVELNTTYYVVTACEGCVD